MSPSQTSDLTSIASAEQRESLHQMVLNVEDSDTIRHEGLELLKRSQDPGITALLVALYQNPAENPRFRSFVMQHIGSDLDTLVGEERSYRITILTQALTHPERPTRREALGALARIRHPDALLLVADKGWSSELWQADLDALVDAAVVMNLKTSQPHIRPLLHHPNPEFRIAAIVAAGEWKDESSRPALTEALESQVFRIRRSAQVALERLGSIQGLPQK